MKRFSILLLLLLFLLPARAQEKNGVINKIFQTNESQDKGNSSKTRRQLLKENEELRRKLEEMELEISSLKTDLTDSLRQELIENEDENIAAGVVEEEDYTAEVTDSLLSVWYLHRQANENHEGEGYNLDSIRFSSDVPDSVFINRLKKMNSFINLPYNETVRNFMILYSEKMPKKMGQLMGLASYYFPVFEESFNKYGLPEELKYLAIIESALNPLAVSRANARGMWQFMLATAKSYGLEINSYVDERYDPFKSADAAAHYLRDAYRVFGDWSLAISSYNCGSGNVNKAIKRSGGKTDFWSIYPYLPKETRSYVPLMVGAMYAMVYHKEYGIEAEPVHLPSRIDTIHVNRNLHFRQISEVIGMPLVELRDLNPQYFNDIIPGNSHPYILRLPYNWSSAFVENENTIYNYKTEEVFSRIEVNNNPGNTDASASARRSSTGTRKATATAQKTITYTVRNGDTLSKISRKYGVSIAQIKSTNHLKSDRIRAGQKLKIPTK